MEFIQQLQTVERLRDPVLVTGFLMQRRAGRLGAHTLAYLVEEWKAEPLAKLDMAPFLNLALYRPDISRTETEVSISWPESTLYLARSESRDVLLLPGTEPNYRWRTFVEELATYLDGLGVRTMVSLRGSRGEVPHTRVPPVYITSTDIELELQFGVQSTRRRNEGPSSIAGVLATRAQAMGWRAVELEVIQPDYFPRMPNAEAMLSMVRLIDKALGTTTPLDSLLETAGKQREMVDQSTSDDAQTTSAIREREETYDRGLARMEFLVPTEAPQELPGGEEILHEVERLLRGSDGESDPSDEEA